MRVKIPSIFLISAMALFILSCAGGPVKDGGAIRGAGDRKEDGKKEGKIFKSYKKPGEYNFKFIGYDGNIDNPENDRRSYYKIYIDKVESGRTTIGLESQKKSFEARMTVNRHVLIVEKWVLDEKGGKYVKLNNIEQPRPNYVYFDLQEDRIVVVSLTCNAESKEAKYEAGFEED